MKKPGFDPGHDEKPLVPKETEEISNQKFNRKIVMKRIGRSQERHKLFLFVILCVLKRGCPGRCTFDRKLRTRSLVAIGPLPFDLSRIKH